RPAKEALGFFRRLLARAYGEEESKLADLAAAGFRVHAGPPGDLPSWTAPLHWSAERSLRRVRYLLTFEPFARLPAAARRAYLAGDLHLLPCPGSLLFWGAPCYARLAER